MNDIETHVLRLIGESVFSMVMVTIGLVILIRGVVLVIWGAGDRSFPTILPVTPVILGELILPSSLLIGAIITVIFTLGLSYFFNRTRIGLTLTAVAEEPTIAMSLGISVKKAVIFAWMMGTAIATVGVGELAEAIKRVALVADRGAQVRMEFADGVVRLSAGADGVGLAEEDLRIEFAGEPLTIAFNPTYLTDGLSSLHSDRVTFGFTTPSKPAVLRPAGDDGAPFGVGPFSAITTDYVYLLMPVRLPG